VKGNYKFIGLFIGAVVIAAGVILFTYWKHFFNDLGYVVSTVPGDWGAFGDYFGGVLNPIVGMATLVLVAITLKLTRAALVQNEEALKQAQEALVQGEIVIKQNANELKASRDELKASREAQQALAEIEKNNFEDRRVGQALEHSRLKLDVLLVDLKRVLKIKWVTPLYDTHYASLSSIIDSIYSKPDGPAQIRDTDRGRKVIRDSLLLMIEIGSQLEECHKLCDRHGLLMAHEAEGFLHYTSIFLIASVGIVNHPNKILLVKDLSEIDELYERLSKLHKGYIGNYISKWNVTMDIK
jgi:hypothetical protein